MRNWIIIWRIGVQIGGWILSWKVGFYLEKLDFKLGVGFTPRNWISNWRTDFILGS